MSFLTDLVEGNFGNLGTDITHAPSSLINNPAQLAEVLGGAAAVSLPFLAPEVIGALGLGDLGGLGAAAADVGAAGAGDVAATDLAASGIPTFDASLAAGGAPEIAASASPEIAALSDFLPAAVDSGALGGLGGQTVGAANALEFAPTAVDTAVNTLGSEAAQVAPGEAGLVAQGAGGAGFESPLTALSGTNSNIAAFTGAPTDLSASEGQQAINAALTGGPSSTAYAAESAPAADVASATGMNSAGGGLGSEVAASSQVPGLAAEGQFAPSVDAQAASAAAAGANAAAPPSAWDTLSNAGSTVGKALTSPLAMAAIPGALLAKTLIQGPQPIPPAADAATKNAIAQLAPLQGKAQQNVDLYNKTAAEDLNLANNFQISPAQAASIETWKQGQMNGLLQQIANQGITNPTQSSEYLQGKNQIDQQALAMQVQMINQLVSTGFQAASAANAGVSTATNVTSALDNTLMQTAQLQIQMDQQYQQAIGSAMQALGLIAGLQGGNIAKTFTSGNALP